MPTHDHFRPRDHHSGEVATVWLACPRSSPLALASYLNFIYLKDRPAGLPVLHIGASEQ